jgi:hypothetical protein
VEYDSGIFLKERVEKMMSGYKMFLESVVENPHQSVSSLPLMSAGEEEEMLTAAWNQSLSPLEYEFE